MKPDLQALRKEAQDQGSGACSMDSVTLEALLDEIETLTNKVARLERENYDLQRRIHDADGLEQAMARNGYGSVNKPPKRRF